jgi:lipid II:glycine glycyltransferase (peptidoglycan interpeptide bridge formation enzyme)
MYLSEEEWKRCLELFPDAHVLQSAEWGELKSGFNWKPVRFMVGGCYAQVLFRSLPGGFSIGYIPKGPLGPQNSEFWQELKHIGRKHRAIMIKIEPDQFEKEGEEYIWSWENEKLIPSKPIQPAQTISIDLTEDEKTILDRMKQKTRYNIHLAEKKDITIHQTDDVRAFYTMMISTGARDGFGVHSYDYYQKAYDLFSPGDNCVLMTARYNEIDLAAIMVFKYGKRCWYFYGASTEIERNRMPVYLLQWQAILWAKRQGCIEYDLWGIPDFPESILEEQFITRTEELWGVYRLKRGFGGKIKHSTQTMDFVLQPLLYKALMWWIKSRRHGVEFG